MSIPSEDVLIHAIGHKIRREILEILKGNSKSFSELLNFFDISTGKLNYHLNQIKGFLTKNNENMYELSPLGIKSLEIIDLIRKEVSETDQPYLKEAFLSQKDRSTKSLIVQGINFGIGGVGFIFAITIFLTVLFFTIPDIPIFIWPIIITMLFGEIMGLIWLIRVRLRSPDIIERIDKHLKNRD
ncbi:MAG: winged helix-turn-helix domain-containing protein [Candidatus Hodarchaeota archaeon]